MKTNSGPKDGYLDLAQAKTIRELTTIKEGHFSILDLDTFTKIDLNAIEYLSQFKYDFVILGIAELTPAIATVMSRWSGTAHIIFNRLSHLDKECAKTLAQSSIHLDFGPLRFLTIDAAKELAKSQGHLHLSLDCLSIEMAGILKEHQSSLSIDLGQEPSLEAAFELTNYQGWQLIIYRLPKPPSKAFMSLLRSNPTKAVTIDRQPIAGEFYWIESIAT